MPQYNGSCTMVWSHKMITKQFCYFHVCSVACFIKLLWQMFVHHSVYVSLVHGYPANR